MADVKKLYIQMIRNIGGGDILDKKRDTTINEATKKKEYSTTLNYEQLEKHIILNTKYKNRSCRGYAPEILEQFDIKPIMTDYGNDVDCFLD